MCWKLAWSVGTVVTKMPWSRKSKMEALVNSVFGGGGGRGREGERDTTYPFVRALTWALAS